MIFKNQKKKIETRDAIWYKIIYFNQKLLNKHTRSVTQTLGEKQLTADHT